MTLSAPTLELVHNGRRRHAKPHRQPSVFLLDADPDLALSLSAVDRLAARRAAVAPLCTLSCGPWAPLADTDADVLGYLVLDGTLVRDVRLGARWCTEILGPEDFLRPWEDLHPLEGVAGESAWTVLEPVRLAVLDDRFAAVAGRWPGLMCEVLARTVRRSRHLNALRALSGIPRLDARLILLMRLLAERWGRVSLGGVAVGLPLTHETIARLAGAQRPSVTTALGRLCAAGHLHRDGNGGWILPPEDDGEIDRLWSELRRGAKCPDEHWPECPPAG
jgi:CRP/FNR family cyclic AMP-dependent transcriptional regulator